MNNLHEVEEMQIDPNQSYLQESGSESFVPTLKDVCGPYYKSVRKWLKHFGILYKSRKKSVFFSNNPSGILHPERLIQGHSDCYEHIASQEKEWLAKTVLIADCSIPEFIENRNIVCETSCFIEVLLNEDCPVYLWTIKGPQRIYLNDVSSGNYLRMSQDIMPITPEGFGFFLRDYNLTPDTAMLLDHENFQPMSHIVALSETYLFDFNDALEKDPYEPSTPTEFPQLQEPNTSLIECGRLLSLSDEAFEIFLSLHNDRQKPLHILFNENTPPILESIAPRLARFKRIFLYTANVESSFWLDLARLIRHIPEQNITGFKQFNTCLKQCRKADVLVAQLVSSLRNLEFLEIHFCQEKLRDSLSALCLQQHSALKGFYFSDETETLFSSYVWPPDITQHYERLLETLPSQLQALRLPRWPLSPIIAQKYIQNKFRNLCHLGLESAIEPITTNWHHEILIHPRHGMRETLGWPDNIQALTLDNPSGFVDEDLRRFFQFSQKADALPTPFAFQRISGSTSEDYDNDSKILFEFDHRNDESSLQNINPYESDVIFISIPSNRQSIINPLIKLQEHLLKQERVKPYKVCFSMRKMYGHVFKKRVTETVVNLISSAFYDAEEIVFRYKEKDSKIRKRVRFSTEELALQLEKPKALKRMLHNFYNSSATETKPPKTSSNDRNDVYRAEEPRTLYYREIFKCQGKKLTKTNYHLIDPKSNYVSLEAVRDLQILTGARHLSALEQTQTHNPSFVSARFTHYSGSGEHLAQNLERVPLPSPGLFFRLEALYCSEKIEGIWYCALRHQYFVDIPIGLRDKSITFHYGLICTAQTTFRVLNNLSTLPASIFDLPRLFDFENGEVTQNSLLYFLQVSHAQGLFLEQMIDIIVLYFKNFKDESLETSALLPDESNLDNLILQQQRGACRHRANLAFKILNALFSYANAQVSTEQHYVSLARSDIHSFLLLNRITYPPGIPEPESLFDNFEAPEANIPNYPEEPLLYSELVCLGGSSRATLKSRIDNSDIAEDMETLLAQKRVEVDEPSISEEENRFLKPYDHIDFDTENDYLNWLAKECANPAKPLLLVIPNWLQWHTIEKISRRFCHAHHRHFACLSSFDDLSLYKLPDTDQLDFRAFLEGRETLSRPYSSLGQLILEPSEESGLMFVAIKQYEPAVLNPLFDHRRLLKEQVVPDTVKRIAIVDEAIFENTGDDFKSRFAKVIKLRFLFAEEPVKNLVQEKPQENPESFYFGEWQASWSQFAGAFQFNGQVGHYTPGWLEQKVRKGIREVVLYNAPKGISILDNMLEKLDAGLLITPFEEIETNIIVRHEKHKIECQFSHLQLGQGHPERLDLVLHTQSFHRLVGQQTCVSETGTIHTLAPYLLEFPKDDWHILVSEPLSNVHWQTLEALAHAHGLKILLFFVNTEDIPLGFNSKRDNESSESMGLKPWYQAANIDWQDGADQELENISSDYDLRVYIDSVETVSNLVGCVQKHNDFGLFFKKSTLLQALCDGKKVLFYGNPNPEIRRYFSSLLCSKPYLIVNGELLFFSQNIGLCFANSPQETPKIEDTTLLSAFDLPNVMRDNPFFAILHHDHIDPIAFMASELGATQTPQYKEPKEIIRWLSSGGVFIVNSLSEAPSSLKTLLRKWHARKDEAFFWKGDLYMVNNKTHRMIFTDRFAEKTHPKLPGIPYFYFNPGLIEQNTPAALQSAYQINTQAFYADYLKAYLSSNDMDDFVSHLHCPALLNKDKQKRKAFWQRCRDIVLTETQHSDFVSQLCPSQSPIALLLILHLRLQETLRQSSKAVDYARGLILEGPPGIGKTKIMFDLLHALGYENKLTPGRAPDPEKPGFVSAPSDDIMLCRKAIFLAKTQGYVLVIDEINTLSLESSYDDHWSIMQQIRFFLSGNSPHHGILLATQNPSEGFSGRNALPFLAYCQKAEVAPLSKKDFAFFLKQYTKGSQNWAREIKRASKLAKTNTHYPPNLRFFMRFLEKNTPAKRRYEAALDEHNNDGNPKRQKLE